MDKTIAKLEAALYIRLYNEACSHGADHDAATAHAKQALTNINDEQT